MSAREPESPLRRLTQVAIVFVALPTLVTLAWLNAGQFDPYTDSYFTKTYVEPTPEMPGEMRIAGLVLAGIGGLVALAGLSGLRKAGNSRKAALLVLLLGGEVMAFGGAFFVAAGSAEDRIALRSAAPATGN